MIKTEWVEALEKVSYKDWSYGIYGASDHDYLQIRFWNDEHEPQFCRRWLLTNGMSADDIIKTAWMATLAAEEHEAREEFRYNGKRIFGPHVSIDFLESGVGLRKNLDIKEVDPHA